MSIHAHLFSFDIIGFIAGHPFTTKDMKKAIFVEEAYPVEPENSCNDDRTKTVEMNAESSTLAQGIASGRGQKICGWYHSHPIFDTNPSKIDIRNQRKFQSFFQRDNNQPFVA